MEHISQWLQGLQASQGFHVPVEVWASRDLGLDLTM